MPTEAVIRDAFTTPFRTFIVAPTVQERQVADTVRSPRSNIPGRVFPDSADAEDMRGAAWWSRGRFAGCSCAACPTRGRAAEREPGLAASATRRSSCGTMSWSEDRAGGVNSKVRSYSRQDPSRQLGSCMFAAHRVAAARLGGRPDVRQVGSRYASVVQESPGRGRVRCRDLVCGRGRPSCRQRFRVGQWRFGAVGGA